METTEYSKIDIQLPLIDMIGGVHSSPGQRNHKVEKILAQLRQLHDDSMRLANPTPNRKEQVTCPH
jgi:hypothetical protein